MPAEHFPVDLPNGASKTARHNLGMRGLKNRSVIAVAYSSGISSSVALLISSCEHKVNWVLEGQKLSDQAIQFMSSFKLVAGKDWDEIAKDEDIFLVGVKARVSADIFHRTKK